MRHWTVTSEPAIKKVSKSKRRKGIRHTIGGASPVDSPITTNITDNVIAVDVGKRAGGRGNTDTGTSTLGNAVNGDLGDQVMGLGVRDKAHHSQEGRDEGHHQERLHDERR